LGGPSSMPGRQWKWMSIKPIVDGYRAIKRGVSAYGFS
jgi:hypothetical protein